MIRLIPIACLMALAVPAQAADAFTCTSRDAVNAANGSFVRSKTTEFIKNALGPIIIDTVLGMIKIGQSETKKWTIVQKKRDGSFDFVARGSSLLVVDSGTIRLRVIPKDSQPTFMFITTGFDIITGTCEAIF